MCSCHLVDLTAAVVTSLMWIRLRTFLGNALIVIITEVLIIQACPPLLNKCFDIFTTLEFLDINYCCSRLCKFTSEAGCELWWKR